MARLSVIVPFYNAGEYLDRAIKSLLNCKEDIKIILIDDGSIDDSYAVAAHYSTYPQIKLMRQDNQGIAVARNNAVKEVETAYFTFLDADDEVESGIYTKLLDKMEKEKADFGFADFTWYYADNKKRYNKDTFYANKKEILINMFASVWNKIYRTSYFRATGLHFPAGLVYEDASLLYRLVPYMDKITYLSESIVKYYQKEGSITHTFSTRINDMIAVFEGILEFYKKNNFYNEYRDELEYLFIRFFLGNSYLRTIRINDKKIRRETLEKAYNFLIANFPDYKNNIYLKRKNKKNFYYRHCNKTIYYHFAPIFRLFYHLGVLK